MLLPANTIHPPKRPACAFGTCIGLAKCQGIDSTMRFAQVCWLNPEGGYSPITGGVIAWFADGTRFLCAWPVWFDGVSIVAQLFYLTPEDPVGEDGVADNAGQYDQCADQDNHQRFRCAGCLPDG